MKIIQAYTNIIFRAFLIGLITFNFDGSIVFSTFFAIFLAHLTELESFNSNLSKYQTYARIFYRSYIIAILILSIDLTFTFAVPAGIIVGLFSEANTLIKK